MFRLGSRHSQATTAILGPFLCSRRTHPRCRTAPGVSAASTQGRRPERSISARCRRSRPSSGSGRTSSSFSFQPFFRMTTSTALSQSELSPSAAGPTRLRSATIRRSVWCAERRDGVTAPMATPTWKRLTFIRRCRELGFTNNQERSLAICSKTAIAPARTPATSHDETRRMFRPGCQTKGAGTRSGRSSSCCGPK